MAKSWKNRKDVVVCRVERLDTVLNHSKSQYGEGPYTGPRIVKVVDQRHPGPHDPGEPWSRSVGDFVDRRAQIFGFESIAQLRRWFHKSERRKLAEAGFSLAFYHVPAGHMDRGKSQVTFSKHESEKVGAVDLLTI